MGIVHLLISLYLLVLVAAALASWFPPRGFAADVQRVLRTLTEPVLRPVRAVLPMVRLGGAGLDLSIFVVMIVLNIVNNLLPR